MTICTTPIRPVPTGFPPMGSMAIIQSLKKIDVDCEFYNIDYFRYSENEIKDYFKNGKFQVVAISAVVSTAYLYTKYISSLIKECLPDALIILGGNLAASAEVILRKTEVDICVVGDGEFIIQDLINQIIKEKKGLNLTSNLNLIKGICYINNQNKFIFTGYGKKPNQEEIDYPNYNILEEDGSLDYFIKKNEIDDNVRAKLPESFSSRWDDSVKSGYTATVISAKGCVARCTFCHRWEKGYRVSPLEKIMKHIDDLNKKYGVTHIDFGDENFGADRKFTRELVKTLGAKGYTWEAGGVRTRTVNFEDLKLWKENGCLRVYFGIESGSEKILKIMEKNATVEENLNALKWVSDLGISTITQLVIGMPGENDESIDETIAFLKKVSDFSIDWEGIYPSELISINYAQALPGTPLYEYARERGFIGDDVDSEESYLLKISDTDAYKEDHFVNYTGLPLLKVLAWRPQILSEIDAFHAINKLGVNNLTFFDVISYYTRIVFYRVSSMDFIKKISLKITKNLFYFKGFFNIKNNTKSTAQKKIGLGYFNIQSNFKFSPLLLNRFTKLFFKFFIYIYIAFWRSGSFYNGIKLLNEYFIWSLFYKNKKNTNTDLINKSLRKVVKITELSRNQDNQNDMTPLRAGR